MTTKDNTLDEQITINDRITHCIGSLCGIVIHTYDFNNEPEKKERQIIRNKEAIKKAELTITILIEQQVNRAINKFIKLVEEQKVYQIPSHASMSETDNGDIIGRGTLINTDFIFKQALINDINQLQTILSKGGKDNE